MCDSAGRVPQDGGGGLRNLKRDEEGKYISQGFPVADWGCLKTGGMAMERNRHRMLSPDWGKLGKEQLGTRAPWSPLSLEGKEKAKPGGLPRQKRTILRENPFVKNLVVVVVVVSP